MKRTLDIATLATSYDSGAITPEDVINDIYDTIAAEGENPVWISLRSRVDALSKAMNAPKGPLYGIPFAVKDNIDVAGLPTTCACPDFAYTPAQSATVVAVLKLPAPSSSARPISISSQPGSSGRARPMEYRETHSIPIM